VTVLDSIYEPSPCCNSSHIAVIPDRAAATGPRSSLPAAIEGDLAILGIEQRADLSPVGLHRVARPVREMLFAFIASAICEARTSLMAVA